MVGVAVNTTGFKVAILDCRADHFPGTDELYRLRSKRSFQYFWEARFPERAPSVAIAAEDHADIRLCLERYGATVHVIPAADLQPFLQTAAEYDVPRTFQPHALAQGLALHLQS